MLRNGSGRGANAQQCNLRSIVRLAVRSHRLRASATSATGPSAKPASSRIRRAGCAQFLASYWNRLNFVPANGYTVQAMHLDCRTMLGPMVKVQSAETLHRLLAYLGATPAQLADLADCTRRWGQGTVQITLVSGRRNLLRLHKWLES
jgi:hypothetical protein